ncbi:MAG: M23 family metallopeptidase [Bacillota bacterium]|nr:M23 family metallopeptidase [Bacillota bacterium]
MKIMKIKEFFKKHRFTLMIIHNSGKTAKQLRLNFVVLYILLGAVLFTNIFLIGSLVINTNRANELDTSNTLLATELQREKDRNNHLQNIVASSNEQILTLKGSLADNAELTEERLKMLNRTQDELDELVSIFNERTNSNLDSASKIASRSRDLSETGSEDAVIRIAKSLAKEDEITSLLAEKHDAYTELRENLDSQLNYLDSRPDFFPTYGSISSGFGYRSDPASGAWVMHNGVDIINSPGTEIYAAASGYVLYAGFQPSYGYVITIDHGYGYKTVYAHLSEILVEEGTYTKKGELVGLMGSTGYSTGTHLHFEIRYDDVPFDPLTMVNPDDQFRQ